MSNSSLYQASRIWRDTPTDGTRVVSTRRRVPTICVSGKMLQPFAEPVVANVSVSSDFLVEGQVSGLGTMHPLLILSFGSTWFLPLKKGKMVSSVMDRLQQEIHYAAICLLFYIL